MSDETKRTYPCRYEGCLSVFKKRSHLVRHELIHTDERPYHCEFEGCTASFRSVSHQKRHEQTHNGEKNLKCPFEGCNVAFIHKWNLKRHIKRTHNGPFKCNKCGKEFKKNKSLQDHIGMEHRSSTIYCDFPGCNAVFKMTSKLKQHVKMHDKGYLCPVKGCSMKFKLWSECRQHSVVCKTKDLNCETCGKVFTEKHNLKAHEKIHSEEREVFQCTYQGCGRFYTKQYNLKVHVKSFHQNIRPFICPKKFCNKSFHFQHLLRRHLDMHAKKSDHETEAPPKKRRRTRRVNASLVSNISGYIPELWKKMTREEVLSYVQKQCEDTADLDSDSDIVKEITTTQNTCTPISSDGFLSDTTVTATETEKILKNEVECSSDTGLTGEADISEDDEIILEPLKSIHEANKYLEETKPVTSSSNSSQSPPQEACSSQYPIKFTELTNRLKKLAKERQKEAASNSSSSNVSLHTETCRMQSLTESESDSEIQQLLMQQCAS